MPSPEEEAASLATLEQAVRAVLAEPDAAYRALPALIQDVLVRCRILGLGSRVPDLASIRRMLALARAGLSAEVAGQPEWAEAQDMAAALPEDMQGVFLLLARAAREGAPCPSDAEIAQAYGSRSLARARRVLGFIEELGAIACRPDLTGRRIIAIVGIGWETAPGSPEAVLA